jgi:hypothetical protein
MKQIEVEYEVGSSSAAISKRSVLSSVFFESKSAQKQNTNWFTGNTKRKYKRKRLVWVCRDGCKAKNIASSEESTSFDYSPKGWLKYNIDHIHTMLGNLESKFLEMKSLKDDVSSKSKLSDENAKEYTEKITKLQYSIEREIVRLGDVYKPSYESIFTKIKRYFIYLLNLVMWVIGIMVLYKLFTQ